MLSVYQFTFPKLGFLGGIKTKKKVKFVRFDVLIICENLNKNDMQPNRQKKTSPKMREKMRGQKEILNNATQKTEKTQKKCKNTGNRKKCK